MEPPEHSSVVVGISECTLTLDGRADKRGVEVVSGAVAGLSCYLTIHPSDKQNKRSRRWRGRNKRNCRPGIRCASDFVEGCDFVNTWMDNSLKISECSFVLMPFSNAEAAHCSRKEEEFSQMRNSAAYGSQHGIWSVQ